MEGKWRERKDVDYYDFFLPFEPGRIVARGLSIAAFLGQVG